jgi:hypothetical protein
MLKADEHFRPAHVYRGHEAEVWVGDRSMSIETDNVSRVHEKHHNKKGTKLVIGKKKEFKVEVDWASRVL